MTESPSAAASDAVHAGALPPEAFSPRLRHHGRLREVIGLALTNLLLKVVTLGLYHFWAKTRVRRYLWSQTGWEDERLVYTGTGRELFLGYLRALVLIIVPIYAVFFAVGWFSERMPLLTVAIGMLFWPLLLYLTGVALYSSWRYRLSRTVWRGIRFGLEGSPWRFGGFFLVQTLLTFATGGLYSPFMQCRVAARVLDQARFGTERFAYEGRGDDLLFPYLRTLGLTLAIGFVGAIGLAILTPILLMSGKAPGAEDSPPWILVVPVLAGLAAISAIVSIWIAYEGTKLRYHVEHTRVGTLRFQLPFRWPEFVRLTLGNVSLLTVTLGLGLPLTAVRTARFIAARLGAAGTLDYGAIAQSQQKLGSTGEGLTQALDLGSL